jgi:glycosyltransferase involved in cell wall biosynthesis
MRIGVDALTLIPGSTGGIGTYITRLVENLGLIDSQNEYVVFANERAVDSLSFEYSNFRIEVCRIPAIAGLGTYLRILFEQFVLPYKIKRLGIDTMIFTANVGCICCPCPGILVVHDMIRHYCAEKLPGQTSFVKDKLFPCLINASIRATTKIVAISQFTKNDIILRLGIPADKIEVVYNGIDEKLKDDSLGKADSSILKNIDKPYVLFVGYHYPYKNLVRLVRAFALMNDSNDSSYQLIIVGREESGTPALMHELKTLNRNDILVLGAVSSSELATLYGKASLFVLPSLIEGFGLPLLEAMAYGVPIAASDAASIPEVVGDAAVLFDPEDEKSIAFAMERVLSDKELAQELIARGHARLKEGIFSWRKTAEGVLAVASSLAACNSNIDEYKSAPTRREKIVDKK